MKQTFKKESIELIKGEIHIIDYNIPVSLDDGVTWFGKDHVAYKVAFTTDKIRADVIHIDRKAFVKPVDVEALKVAAWYKEHNISHFGDHEYELFSDGYDAGYKANPNEFTREDMIQAVKYGAAYADAHGHFNMEQAGIEFIDSLRPLSIPASVTIENNQVIEVIWKIIE